MNALNLFYTVLMFGINFTLGVTLNIIGASMVDLSFIYNVSINTNAYLTFGVYFGYLSGSFVNYLYCWLNRQLTLALIVLLMGISIGLMPFAGNVYIAILMSTMCGVGNGAWDSAASLLLVEIWPSGKTALLQGLQFMYGVGAITGPLLVSPFLYGKVNVTGPEDRVLTVDDRIHSLTLPFALTGVITALFSGTYLVMYFICPYRKSDQIPEGKSKNLDTESVLKAPSLVAPIPHRLLKLTLVAFAVGTYISAESNFLLYSSTMYQYLDIHLSATQAAHIQSVLSATFTLGRLIAAFISLKVPIDTILSVHYLIQLASMIFLYFGRNSETVIFLCTASLGLGFSAIWPGMFAFTETNLRLTDRICSLFVFLSGSIATVTPLILGQVFKSYPILLMYITTVYIIISMSLFLTAKYWNAIKR